MGRLQASWSIFKFSVNFVKSEKKLLLFPLITFLIQIVLVLIVVGIAALVAYNTYENIGGAKTIDKEFNQVDGNINQLVNNESGQIVKNLFTTQNNILIIIGLIVLFAVLLIGNLFSIAVINSVFQKIETDKIDVKLALRNTFSNISCITQWTLFNFIIGTIMHYIIKSSERIPFLSVILSAILNSAWVTFTFFSLPILAIKKFGPIKTLKTSSKLIFKKFGQGVISLGGLMLINIIWFLSVICLGFLLFNDIKTTSIHDFLTQLNLVIFVVYFVLSLCILILLSLVYRATVFMYCLKGVLPKDIHAEEINNVISYKTSKYARS